MKILIKVFLSICLYAGCVSNLQSQNYLAVGFAGKDTIHAGKATIDKNGKVQLQLKDGYKGFVQLVPQTAAYAAVEKNFEQWAALKTTEEVQAAQKYVNESLDFTTLYRTPLWRNYVQNWVGSYMQSSKSAEEFVAVFIPAAKQVLERIKGDKQAASHLSKNLIEIFEQYNQEKLAVAIASLSLGLNIETTEHSEAAHRVIAAAKLIGQPAPAIETDNGKTADFKNKTLLFFYETTCGNCHDEAVQMIAHYEAIKTKGFRVISISADKEKEPFESLKMPWTDKLCDFKGFDGANFKNFGIVATPTFYVVENGIITGRYASLAETRVLN